MFKFFQRLNEAKTNRKLAAAEKLAQACELVIAVRSCMMFDHIHADFAVKEVLDKHGVESVQLLAKLAQDKAEAALKEWNA